jgi:hypothetical protein
VLLDKTGILTGAVFPGSRPVPDAQVETLRSLVYWFWHDLSHFITALGRGQRWSAAGHLEDLRRQCVNLARLRQNFAAEAAGYEKVDLALPSEQLAPLQETFCPLEQNALLRAAFLIVRFYRDLAPSLAQAHGITYPLDLERVMCARLEKLGDTPDRQD